MPTVGWIQETAIDRYWERGELSNYYPPRPRHHYCPYCEKNFVAARKLSTHISVEHPLEMPIIFLGNRTALSEQTIRIPLSKNEIELVNVQKIWVSKDLGRNEEWTLEELKEKLSSEENAHYSITLKNSGLNDGRSVEANYIFRIKIADKEGLNLIDEKFIRVLAIDDVRMRDIRIFADDCTGFPGVDEYANALAIYVTGVLVKDQNKSTGITLPFSAYKEKMQRALEVLRDFDRPIARAICASIRFNLNDFRKRPLRCGANLIDDANELFFSIAENNKKQPWAYQRAVGDLQELPACPIDQDSFELLSFFQRLRSGKKVDVLMGELSESTASKRVSDYDRSKLWVLIALASNAVKEEVVRLQVLEDLANDPTFGDWAATQLVEQG